MKKTNRTRTGIECLKLFVKRVERIQSFSIMQMLSQHGSKMNVSWTAKSGKFSVSVTGPNTEQIDAVLYTMRLFIQDNDDISIRNTARLYESLPISTGLRNAFIMHRNGLNAFLDTPCPITINKYRPMRKELFWTILYGDGAHLDQDKWQRLQTWVSHPLAKSFIEVEFVNILNMFIQTIMIMAEINRRAISELEIRSDESNIGVNSWKTK